jgi:hypothetical protein
MNFKHFTRVMTVAGALLLSVAPTFAATRPRAFAPVPDVTVTGKVVDAATGAVLADAQVANGTRTATTGADGSFSIKVQGGRPTVLTVTRWGYDNGTQTITPGNGAISFSLLPRAVITVKDTSGTTYSLDYDQATFAYLIPLSGYARSDSGNFCTPGGVAFTPNKSEIAKIIGPATLTTDASCCHFGPTLGIDVQLKDGQTRHAIFVDACFGNEVDFISRDRNTGQFVYLSFANIAEITFP